MNLSRIPPRWLCVAAVCLPLTLSACGDDEDGGDQPAASTPTTTQAAPPPTTETTETEEAPAEETPPGGEKAVTDAIVAWTFEGKCELMTDKFLEEQAFVGDNRKERCKYFEDSFQKPQYSESDMKFSGVKIDGAQATATVGSDVSNVEAEYKLVAQDGKWVIDEVSL